MSQSYLTGYQPLGESSLHREEGEDEDLSPNHHSNMMIHVVSESGQTRWNHIEDLDSFFTRVYQYHQQKGLLCMMLQQFLELVQFLFMIIFITFLWTCIDYDILFHNKPAHPDNNPKDGYEKITLSDIIVPFSMDKLNFSFMVAILVSIIFLVLKSGHVVMNYFYFYDIKKFYNTALGINDGELENVTWDEVQHRVMEVQIEQRMCIHKETLTELDIYHRILRFNNYFIAMINKNIISLKYEIPFCGDVIFLTRGLRYNLEILLFWGPYAPFKNNWHLADEYKCSDKRRELAEELSKRILYMGILNFVLSPFILLWQILYSFFHYTEMIKREPGALGSRRWSHYGEVYLRHFNELDHELHARLNRGYRASSQYMNIYSSPLMAVVARHIAFVAGAMLAVIAVLAVYDEDVFQVEHLITIFSGLAGILATCKVFIPDDNLVWCPELLMTRVLAEVHYLPDCWRGKAHTSQVRKEFSQLFQYRIVHMIEELISPIVTPLILCFRVRHRALAIVDFFRHFTVEVTGVGDICSFAQMDVRKHGSKTWQPTTSDSDLTLPLLEDGATRTDGGKTELSLLHFTMTNPQWKPPRESSVFLEALKVQAQKDFSNLAAVEEEGDLMESITSLTMGLGAIGNSVLRSPWLANNSICPQASVISPSLNPQINRARGGINRLEGSRRVTCNGLLNSIIQPSQLGTSDATGFSDSNKGFSPSQSFSSQFNPALPRSISPQFSSHPSLSPALPQPQDLTAIDMGVSTLYLHQIHQRKIQKSHYRDQQQARESSVWNPFSGDRSTHYQPPRSPSVGDLSPSFNPPAFMTVENSQRNIGENIPLLKEVL